MAIGLDNKLNFGTKYPDKTPRELIESGKIDYIIWISKNTTREFGRNVWFEIKKKRKYKVIKNIEKVFIEELEENIIKFDIEKFKISQPNIYNAIINTVLKLNNKQL